MCWWERELGETWPGTWRKGLSTGTRRNKRMGTGGKLGVGKERKGWRNQERKGRGWELWEQGHCKMTGCMGYTCRKEYCTILCTIFQ